MATKLEDEIRHMPIMREPLYDDSPDPYADETGYIKVMPGLSAVEKTEARMLHRYSKGLMIVSGDPGSGKGLFSNTFAWKIRRYFGKPLLLDYHPRPLMDYKAPHRYTPFDVDLFVEEMEKMHEVSRGVNIYQKALDNASIIENTDVPISYDKWLETQGKLRFQNAIIVLDEFHRYMDKTRQMANINKYMGGLIRLWRHLDLLIIGVTQNANDDLEAKRCLKYVSHDVRTQWCAFRKDTAICQIYPMRYVSSDQVIQIAGKPFKIMVDGRKPRRALNGKRYYDLYPSKNVMSMVNTTRKIEL